MITVSASQPVEMRIVDIQSQQVKGSALSRHVMVLQEVMGTRRLTLGIDPFLAEAVMLHQGKITMPQPLTFTFIAHLLKALGGQLSEVRINKLVKGTYYATVVVEGATGIRAVTARPADALILAVMVGAPISADPMMIEVMED